MAMLAPTACGKKSDLATSLDAQTQRATAPTTAPDAGTATAQPQPKTDDEGPQRGIALALSTFEGKKPGPARAEILFKNTKTGKWEVTAFEDRESNVFHKVLPLLSSIEPPQLITLGGSKAAVKGWRGSPEGFKPTTYWREAFGGKLDRMRDAEIGDVDADNQVDIVVGTHDQGVLAYLKRKQDKPGEWTVEKLDRQKNISIEEIELGDLDRDGVLEIYATPTEPNRLATSAQPGRVVRYSVKSKEKRVVVADLGKRHAKEILVQDVDGDGADELYVAVEALTQGEKDNVQIVEPIDILRFDADTKPGEGKLIAQIPDRYCRCLTAGDLDGDRRKELYATCFRTGVWLLRPDHERDAPWSVQSLDTKSSGFEQAALATDLDGDGTDELYVAADDQGEVRQYFWRDGKYGRETLLKREDKATYWTWNITAVGQ